MKRVRMPGPLGSGTAYFSMMPSTKERCSSGMWASIASRLLCSGMPVHAEAASVRDRSDGRDVVGEAKDRVLDPVLAGEIVGDGSHA